ncbi:MAG: HAD family phosphatase [Saprospiraceae bacterium]|nr:HAD family phosphatase [Saprospiraceae bacterium]MBK8828044.1 HAD family phosphatase [Saprospiraceae bacterium]
MTRIKNNKKIQNIVFDFGGVLLDLDYTKTHDAMSKLLGFEFMPATFAPETTKFLNEYEIGKINTETFIWNLQRLAKKEVPIGQDVIKAWNAMLLGWQPAKFDFLLSLRKKYKTYLLSNTNELHLTWVLIDLKKQHHISDFDTTYFEKTYYSHLIGMRKPDSQIFEFVTQDARFDPAETLFIDDLEVNTLAAKVTGWNVYQHDPKDDLIQVFTEKLKLM